MASVSKYTSQLRDPRELGWKTPAKLFFAGEDDDCLWLVDQLVPLAGNMVLGADPKVGKTWFALAIAFGVASGRRTLGMFDVVGGPKPVLYVAGEGRKAALRKRGRAIAKAYDIDPTTLPIEFVTRESRFRLDDPTWQEAICIAVEGLHPSLIVLDPFSDLHLANENDRSEIVGVLNFLSFLSEYYFTTILLVHHLRKSRDTRNNTHEDPLDPRRLRGSTAIQAWYDTAMILESIGKGTLRVDIEHRDAEELPPLKGFIDTTTFANAVYVGVTLVKDIDPKKKKVVKSSPIVITPEMQILRYLMVGPKTTRDIERKLGIRADELSQLVEGLVNRGLIQATIETHQKSKRGRPISIKHELTISGKRMVDPSNYGK